MDRFENKLKAVRKAYEEGLYEPALALALTLPDICAAIEFPNIEYVGERYIKWSNSHIFSENPSNINENFAGAALYQLRCNFLHSGNSDIYKDTGNPNARVVIKKFDLMLPKENDEGVGELLLQTMTWKDDQTQEETYTVKMNLRHIVDEICYAASAFYEGWSNKSDFDDHSVCFLEYGSRIEP